jgi:hypothetical protein
LRPLFNILNSERMFRGKRNDCEPTGTVGEARGTEERACYKWEQDRTVIKLSAKGAELFE